MHVEVVKYLEDVGINYQTWSRFKGQMYDILTTNIAKSINALIKELIIFSITQLDYHFRLTMHGFMIQRKQLSQRLLNLQLRHIK